MKWRVPKIKKEILNFHLICLNNFKGLSWNKNEICMGYSAIIQDRGDSTQKKSQNKRG